MNKERLVTLTLIILAAATARLLPHPHNVAPIAAIALFAGAHFERKWQAFVLPLLAMLVSDAIIGFYDAMWVTYLAFATVVCLGFLLRKNKSFLAVAGATVSGSVLFFLVSNFALWMHHNLYPHTLDGIMESYTMALPFFRNTLIGDLFYSGLLFGGFALAERKFTPLRSNRVSA
jgi:hypothetical protein